MKKPHTLEFYKKLSIKKLRYVWRWRTFASNGRKTGASTESYYNRSECEQNAKDVFDAIQVYFINKFYKN